MLCVCQENPADEDAQIVEKILGVRTVKRKLVAQVRSICKGQPCNYGNPGPVAPNGAMQWLK